MRIIQLRLDDDTIDLHPMVTVIRGLDTARRERVMAAISAIPLVADPGIEGLVESHGVLFDLSTESLELLGTASDLDPVVRSGDLPPGPLTDQLGRDPRMSAEQFLAAAPEGRFPDLDAARAQQRSSRETLAILRESAEKMRADHAELASRLRRAEAALAARGAPRSGAGPVAGTRPDRDALVARAAELEDRLSRIDQGIAELTALDVRPVEVLAEAIRNPAPSDLVASARAIALADEFAALRDRVDDLERALEREGRDSTSALKRLEDARAALAHAERAFVKPDLSSDDIAELEAAHSEVLDAESKLSGLRRRGAQQRFDDAVAGERAILDRVGFPTWSAYIMGAGLLAIDPLAEQRLTRAQAALVEAEQHWSHVAAAIEADPEHRATLDRLERVYHEASELLGGGDEQGDLEQLLRELRVPDQELTPEDLVDALAYQLEQVGLELGPDIDADRTLLAADAFLAEVRGLTTRLAELRHERAKVEDSLGEIRSLIRRSDSVTTTIDLTDDASGISDEADLERLTAERDAARDAEAEHGEALGARLALVDGATQVDALAASRAVRIAAELMESESIDDPERAGGAGPLRGKHDDQPRAVAIEGYLMSRIAAQGSLPIAGSVPLVLDDVLAGLGEAETLFLLDRLSKASGSVQILFLSDEPVVTGWADSAGPGLAAVVSLPRQYA